MKNIINTLAFLLIIGCSSITDTDNGKIKGFFGVNFDKKYNSDYYQFQAVEDIKTRISILSDYHVRFVTIHKTYYINGINSSELLDELWAWKSYPKSELIEIIQYAHNAHSKNTKVQLAIEIIPIIEDPNGWYVHNNGIVYGEGSKISIAPDNPNIFFSNLKQKINLLLDDDILDVEMINLCQELVNLTGSEYYQNWKKIVDLIRARYSNEIVYYMNRVNEYQNIPIEFWNLFDYIGLTFYPENLSENPVPTTSEIKDTLEQELINELQVIYQETQKEIIIGETSCPTIRYCLKDNYPIRGWDMEFLQNKIYEEQGQKNYVEALIQLIDQNDFINGCFWHNAYSSYHYNYILEEKGPCPFKMQFEAKKMLQIVKQYFQ